MTPASIEFHHQIESPLPLRAVEGYLELRGWCLARGRSQVPYVHLKVGSDLLSISQRISRPDVIAAISGHDSATECGFAFAVKIKSGAYIARLEASTDNLTWSLLREFTILASPSSIQTSIEWPASGKITESVRIQGWCLHPNHPLREVELHYGNQRVACDYGSPREDVQNLFPDVPHARMTGFISSKNLPVGRGALRIRAIGDNGECFYAATTTEILIERDEDHLLPLHLEGNAVLLGPVRIAPPSQKHQKSPHPLRILFVLYGDFTSNSAVHVVQLANELTLLGHECIVAVPHHAETIRYHDQVRFKTILFSDYKSDHAQFLNRAPPDCVHAWTTRENVRRFCESIGAGQKYPLVVHLEDHEQQILQTTLNLTDEEISRMPAEQLNALVPDTLSHPKRSHDFLNHAQGITAILDRLLELAPPKKPHAVIWPAADQTTFFPRPYPREFRRALRWEDKHTILFYHGNVHHTNRVEMRELYAAVLMLNELGFPTSLIRTGRNACEFLGDIKKKVEPHIIDLGPVYPQHYQSPIMAIADFFVQPGEADNFNDFRFPSKYPEFFAIGRPVIVPRTNLGNMLRHLEDAYVLEKADAPSIVDAIKTLRANPALRQKLSENAVRFSQTHFSWAVSAAKLDAFYNKLLYPHESWKISD